MFLDLHLFKLQGEMEMMKKFLVSSFCAVLLCACSMEKADDQTGQTQMLVDRAAELVEKEGQAAFPKFAESEWYHGEQYVFIISMDGVILMNPAQPEIVGRLQLNLADADGKLIVQDFIQQMTAHDSAWTEYRWPKPVTKEIAPKRTYIRKAKMPNQSEVIVGSGFYE